MDNLTHSVAGAFLAKTGLRRLSPIAAPTLVAAANLPDLDIVVTLFGGRPAYLVHHRGITHAVLGVVVEVLLLAWITCALDRRRERRRGGAPAGTLGAHALLAACGLATHPFLDLLNIYGLRPWLPLDATTYYGDLVFIVDPWLWMLFGGTAAIAGPRSRGGTFGLALLATIGSLVVYSTSRTPPFLRIVWPVGVATIALLRASGVGRERARAWTTAAAIVFAGYLGALAVLGDAALERGVRDIGRIRRPGEPVLAATSCPAPGNPFAWTVIVETQVAVYRLPVRLLGRPGGAPLVFEKGTDDPRVRWAWRHPDAAAWRSFARHPIAAVEAASDGTWVHLMDARYQLRPATPGTDGSGSRGAWASAVIPIEGGRR